MRQSEVSVFNTTGKKGGFNAQLKTFVALDLIPVISMYPSLSQNQRRFVSELVFHHLLFATHRVVNISSKDFKGLHVDSTCQHTWVAVTSPWGLERHQKVVTIARAEAERARGGTRSDRGTGRDHPWTRHRCSIRKKKASSCNQTKTLTIMSCLRVSLSPYDTKKKTAGTG